MIRGDWKAREGVAGEGPITDTEKEVVSDDNDVPEEQLSDAMDEDSPPASDSPHTASDIDVINEDEEDKADEADVLAHQMGSLSLVPNAIRFGRGGNRGGFKSRGFAAERSHVRGRGRGRGAPHKRSESHERGGSRHRTSERGLEVDAPVGNMGIASFVNNPASSEASSAARGRGIPRARPGVIHIPRARGSRGRGRGS
jgi:hypothetical protein